MKKQILLAILTLASLISASAQNDNAGDLEKIRKGDQIITNARKVIGSDKATVTAFHLKSKTSYTTEIKTPSGISLPDNIDEINIITPDKIQWTSAIEKPIPSKSTSICNGKEYKKLLETDFLGLREIKDVTELNSKSKENYNDFKGKLAEKRLEMLKRVADTDPKENFLNRLWTSFFPLTLIYPFKQNIEFKYVGRAESGNRIANVVDIKPKNGITYRLLFDSETNHLLLMIINHKRSDGDYEAKHYYSNRQLVNNLLIPKTIKVEQKFTPNGKASNISYMNIDIEEFSLNPKFKPNLFDVN